MSAGDNYDQSIDCPSCGERIRIPDELARKIYDEYLQRQLDELSRDVDRRLDELRAELAVTPQSPAPASGEHNSRPEPHLG